MKLIIEIPDHIYEHAKNMSEDSYDEWDAMRAIAKGFLYEERPHGEWICKGSVGNGTWCTVCDTNIKLFPNRYSFCPNCGALMYAVQKIKKAGKRNE